MCGCAPSRKALSRACSQQSCSGSCALLLLLPAVAAALAQQEKEAAAARLQAAEREKGVIVQQLQEALQGQAAAEAGLQAVQLEVQVAKAGLQEADERVAAMRSAAAAANTDFNGKLAAKSAQLQELQSNNGKLSEQLAGAQAAKAQAAAHAGDHGPLLLCAALLLCSLLHPRTLAVLCQSQSRPGQAVLPRRQGAEHPTPLCCVCPSAADELQRNIDRLASELHATRQEVQQLSEELLALHEHADMETAHVSGALSRSSCCCSCPVCRSLPACGGEQQNTLWLV